VKTTWHAVRSLLRDWLDGDGGDTLAGDDLGRFLGRITSP
jgi:hypothetical protein